MRGRRSHSPAARYGETCFFGTRLGELLDEYPLSQQAVAEEIGTARENLSAYRNGRGLPPLETMAEMLEGIVNTLVPRKKDRPRVRRELEDLLHADLLAAWMGATNRTVKDVERYLGIVRKES